MEQWAGIPATTINQTSDHVMCCCKVEEDHNEAMQRFIQDILCLPGNDSQRINIVFNNAYREYYLTMYK